MARSLKKCITVICIIALLISFNATYITALDNGYSNDVYNTSQWHHRYVNTQEAWDLIDKYVTPHEKVIIASVDCGCSKDKVEFSDIYGNLDIDNCVKVSGNNIIKDNAEPKFNHGTVIAGIMGAKSNNGIGIAGVAAGNKNNISKMMCINVSTETQKYFVKNKKRDTTSQNIINGLHYAADHGARVIHMCLGHDKTYRDANGKKFDSVQIQNEIKKILDEHPEIIIIASAGNHHSPDKWYVSDYQGVISVINTSKFNNIYSENTRYQSSNYGKNKTISAPGNGVYAKNLYDEKSDEENLGSTSSMALKYTKHGGTSTASAVAAGVAALIIYANPDLNRDEVIDIIKESAVDLYKEGRDDYTAYGNINAYNGVIMALEKANKYTDLPKVVKSVKDENMKLIKISSSVKGKSIKLKWNKTSSTLGKINQYRLYVSSSKNGTYKKIATLSSTKTSYTYKAPKSKKKYYFKVKPYGTTVIKKDDYGRDITETKFVGRKLISADDGDSSIVCVKSK